MPIDVPPQTPFYRALHKERYSRWQLIKDIQNETHRQLIVYIANTQHPGGGINQNDVLAFGDLLEGKAGGRLSPVYFPLLQQLDPALLDFCKKAVTRSRRFAEKWLKKSQCKNNPKKAKEIAKKLVAPKRYLLHGTVIDHTEASDELGLRVRYLPPDDPLWQAIWRVYCTYEAAMRDERLVKLFESATVSIPFK